jgi:hypothetical protein
MDPGGGSMKLHPLVAEPTAFGATGDLVTNHTGAVFDRTDRPFELRDDRRIPDGALPIGR